MSVLIRADADVIVMYQPDEESGFMQDSDVFARGANDRPLSLIKRLLRH